MASIIPPIPWPSQTYLATQGSVPAFSAAHTLDATTDQFELHFQAVEAATITTVVVRVNAITGTAGTARVGIQGSSATTGAASGTWLGATNTGYADISSYGSAGACLAVTLGESVTVARGDTFCIVVDPISGTWDASNSIALTYSAVGGLQQRIPYAILNGTKTATVIGIGGYRSDSKSYGNIVETITNVAPTTATTPDEIALKWSLPSLCSSYQVVGARISASWTAGRTFTMRLFDSDGTTVLQSVDRDTDQGIAGQGTHDFYFDETTLSTLSPGTSYRLSFLPAASSSTASVATWACPTSGDVEGMTGGGASYSTRTDAGSWTDTDTQMPCFQVLISDMTVAGGGSGGGGQIFAAGVVR